MFGASEERSRQEARRYWQELGAAGIVVLGFKVWAVLVVTFWVWELVRFNACALMVSGSGDPPCT